MIRLESYMTIPKRWYLFEEFDSIEKAKKALEEKKARNDGTHWRLVREGEALSHSEEEVKDEERRRQLDADDQSVEAAKGEVWFTFSNPKFRDEFPWKDRRFDLPPPEKVEVGDAFRTLSLGEIRYQKVDAPTKWEDTTKKERDHLRMRASGDFVAGVMQGLQANTTNTEIYNRIYWMVGAEMKRQLEIDRYRSVINKHIDPLYFLVRRLRDSGAMSISNFLHATLEKRDELIRLG